MKDYVGAVMLNGYGDIYLIKENDINQIGRNKWNLPGGSIDNNEGMIEAIKREALEETGYNTEVIALLGCYKSVKNNADWLYVVFQLKVLTKTSEKTDPEVKEGKWFKPDEFLSLPDDQIVHPDMKIVYQVANENRGLNLETVKFINYN